MVTTTTVCQTLDVCLWPDVGCAVWWSVTSVSSVVQLHLGLLWSPVQLTGQVRVFQEANQHCQMLSFSRATELGFPEDFGATEVFVLFCNQGYNYSFDILYSDICVHLSCRLTPTLDLIARRRLASFGSALASRHHGRVHDGL